jgi:hypothetical protein
MPWDEDELNEMRFYPQLTTDPVDQEKIGQLNDEVIQRIGGIPYFLDQYPGQLIAARYDGTSTDLVSRVNGPVNLGANSIWQFRPLTVTTDVSVIMTDNDHLGARLKCINTSPIILTFGASEDPLNGIGEDFVCQIARMKTAALVTLSLGSLTNGHPNNWTNIGAGGIIEVWLTGGVLCTYGGMVA